LATDNFPDRTTGERKFPGILESKNTVRTRIDTEAGTMKRVVFIRLLEYILMHQNIKLAKTGIGFFNAFTICRHEFTVHIFTNYGLVITTDAIFAFLLHML
jgi:hypothetical protein